MGWQEEFEQIAKDNIHGATYLLQKAAKVLEKLPDLKRREAIKKLPFLQPYMASFYNLARFLENGGKLEEFFANERRQKEALIQKASKLIEEKRVLTHSFSSLVFEAIKSARNVSVITTKSAPLNEGEAMAKELFELGVDVRVIEDAAAAYMVKDVDIVLFGADGIGDFGLVHKIGSLGIALAAKLYEKPLYALATPSKFWPRGFRLPPQPLQNPKEVSELPAINYYFDVTLWDYFLPLTSD
ncbi:MAG: hypothetical protein C6H99_06415 [Epsilonproteobacteria bacterium]|nr:hypothetical protein [Campylobacterota bacterium]NPA64925.1 hypothetical protein [Campylobacterota bacterium]